MSEVVVQNIQNIQNIPNSLLDLVDKDLMCMYTVTGELACKLVTNNEKKTATSTQEFAETHIREGFYVQAADPEVCKEGCALGCDFDETDKTCYEYCVKHACFGVPHYP